MRMPWNLSYSQTLYIILLFRCWRVDIWHTPDPGWAHKLASHDVTPRLAPLVSRLRLLGGPCLTLLCCTHARPCCRHVCRCFDHHFLPQNSEKLASLTQLNKQNKVPGWKVAERAFSVMAPQNVILAWPTAESAGDAYFRCPHLLGSELWKWIPGFCSLLLHS